MGFWCTFYNRKEKEEEINMSKITEKKFRIMARAEIDMIIEASSEQDAIDRVYELFDNNEITDNEPETDNPCRYTITVMDTDDISAELVR